MEVISVIIPVYNAKKYLNKCIDSILNQTYSNLECILVDDGSTDGSSEICDFYGEKDKRVKVLHQKNMGQSTARNTGIKSATGTYICFVDNDDALPDADTLFEMKNAMGNKDVLIADEEIFKSKQMKKIDKLAKYYNPKMSGGGYLCALIKLGQYKGTVWSKLYKKELFIDNNIWFSGNLICEDEEISPRLFDKTDKITFLNRKCYERYRNPESQTNTIDEKTFLRKSQDRLEVAWRLKKYFDENKYPWRSKRVIYKHICGLYLQGISFAGHVKNFERLLDLQRQVESSVYVLTKGYKYGLMKYYFAGVILKIFGLKGFLRKYFGS